jgi:hypothetical protein
MQNKTNTESKGALELQLTDLVSSSASVSSARTDAYFEMEDVPVRSLDLIEELNKNLSRVEDLSARFAFQMREVRYLLKM